jgi:hypothetical protein
MLVAADGPVRVTNPDKVGEVRKFIAYAALVVARADRNDGALSWAAASCGQPTTKVRNKILLFLMSGYSLLIAARLSVSKTEDFGGLEETRQAAIVTACGST